MDCARWRVVLEAEPVRNAKIIMVNNITHVAIVNEGRASSVVAIVAILIAATIMNEEEEEVVLIRQAEVAVIMVVVVKVVEAVAEVKAAIVLTTTIFAQSMADTNGESASSTPMVIIIGRGQAIQEIRIPRVEETARGAETLIMLMMGITAEEMARRTTTIITTQVAGQTAA